MRVGLPQSLPEKQHRDFIDPDVPIANRATQTVNRRFEIDVKAR